jgi:uncharacterized membrane protein
MTSALLFVHLLAFAAYVGAGFAQLRLMKRSDAVAAPVRDELESLSATVITKIELPAIFVSMITGGLMLARTPEYLPQGWLHGKLTAVLLLAVLSHLEMFNARKLVRARAAGREDEVATRKKRHATFGAIGALLVAVVLVMVTYVRLHGA